MKLRKTASIALAISTLVITVSGVLLYFKIGPHGIMKDSHIVFSISFILAAAVHFVLNFKPLKNYVKGAGKLVPSKDLLANAALAAVFFVLVGIGSSGSGGGKLQYPSVENMPLSVVLESEGIDYGQALYSLEQAGYVIPDNLNTLSDLSSANKTSPKLLYSVMSAEKAPIVAMND